LTLGFSASSVPSETPVRLEITDMLSPGLTTYELGRGAWWRLWAGFVPDRDPVVVRPAGRECDRSPSWTTT
jgi:hypothetical protein